MEFKIRANIIMSKDLTIEADNLGDAMDKAQKMMQEKINLKEFKPTSFQYELLD